MQQRENEVAESKQVSFGSKLEALATLKKDLELTSDWLTTQKEW